MKICVIYPSSRGLHTGNAGSAGQWGAELEASGYEVRVAEGEVTGCCDVAVVLHGVRGREAMADFKTRRPGGRVVVVLTGTDLYDGGGTAELEDTMREADRLVVLQPKALERVPAGFHAKTRVILQGAAAMVGPVENKSTDPFRVCVVGHLREVKDPLRTGEAVRLLPETSRIVVRQAGGILEDAYRQRVADEEARNPRYEWLGELPEPDVRRLMATSQVMVISSREEGGARVVGESIVEGTPVLGARCDGVEGLLGPDYEGYFQPGDTAALVALLDRAERDATFLSHLHAQCRELAPQWEPAVETAKWNDLMSELQ